MVLTLQLRAAEVFQDFLPVGWVVVSAEVWLELSTEYSECRALSDAVCSYKPQHLPWSRRRQPVELEAVGRIAVSDLSLEVGRQIDDMNGAKRAFLGTDTTADAKAFGYEGDLGLGGDLNAEFAGSNDRTGLFALLTTFLKLVSDRARRDNVDEYKPWVCTSGEVKGQYSIKGWSQPGVQTLSLFTMAILSKCQPGLISSGIAHTSSTCRTSWKMS